MKWGDVFSQLNLILDEIYKAIYNAIEAGKRPAEVHQVITDHMTGLPGKIRGV